MNWQTLGNKQMLSGLLALSLLGACGSPGSTESTGTADGKAVVIASDTGTTVISTAGGSSPADQKSGTIRITDAKDLPVYAPAYPGAEIKTRVASASSEEGSGSLIAMRTADPFEQVVAFYDLKAKQAPFPPHMVTNEKDAAIRIFGNEATSEGALVAISRDSSGSGTVIVITSGKGTLVPKDKAEAAKVAASQGVRLQ